MKAAAESLYEKNVRGLLKFLLLSLLAFLIVKNSLSQQLVLSTPLKVKCDNESVSNWDFIKDYYYGVAGNGFIDKDEWIGLCEAKYKWGGPWKPIDGYKHTLCGNLSIKKRKGLFNKADSNNKYHLISDGDGDLVLYIIPDSSFHSLLHKSLRPQGHYFKDSSLSCEVALNESGNTIASDAETFFQSMHIDKLQNKSAGVYGPWVSDIHHEKSPEIHPVQQLWIVEKGQNETLEYRLYSFFDNSSRFNDKSDFPEKCFLKPWITVPLVNVFYVPFSISVNSNIQLVYDIEMPSSNNINLYDSLEKQLKMVVNGKVKLIVNKPDYMFPLVTFYDVCQIDSNTIHGYLKIETSVGKVNDDSGAHVFLNMVLSKKNIPE